MGTEFSNSVPSRCHAPEASIIDPAPGPEWISAEVISRGNVRKSMTCHVAYAGKGPGTLRIHASRAAPTFLARVPM